MAQFVDLPELVIGIIIGIIQNAPSSVMPLEDQMSYLQLLAINQRCRQVGLPKVLKN